MALVAQGIADWPRPSMAVIGSSLGGFYASWVAQHAGCHSVMLNPAVDPARDLARYIGEQTTWHDPNERFYFLPEYIDELQALDMRVARPQPLSWLSLPRATKCWTGARWWGATREPSRWYWREATTRWATMGTTCPC